MEPMETVIKEKNQKKKREGEERYDYLYHIIFMIFKKNEK
jgi:hypothetical protein